jgi:hypothetical protein
MILHCEHALFYANAYSTLCFVLFAMDGNIKQHVCIKFCVKLNKSAVETLEMLLENILEVEQWFFKWLSRLKAGQVLVEDDKRSGRPSTSKMTENVETIQELINKDQRRTTHELDTVGISYGVHHEFLTENLNMLRIALKFIPRLLTDDQSSPSSLF